MKYLKLSVFILPLFCFFILTGCTANTVDRADSYYREGAYDKAETIYISVLKKRPNEVMALKGMGDIKNIKQDYTAAIDYYKKSIEINPDLAKKELVSLLTYSSLTVRSQAATAISELSNGIESVLDEIVSQLQQSNQFSKIDYLEALRRIGPKASSFTGEIVKHLSSDNSTVRKTALETLSVMNIASIKEAEAIDLMVELMKDPDPVVAETAVKSIGALKSGAVEVISEVVKMLNNSNPILVEAAKKSLESIGPGNTDSIPGLIKLIDEKNPTVIRVRALDSLALIGPQANDIVFEIIPLIRDNNNEVRISAVYALSKIGRPSNDSVSDLTMLLQQHSDPVIKLRVIAELSEMGKASLPALPVLQQLRRSSNKEIRQEAAKAVEKINKAKR